MSILRHKISASILFIILYAPILYSVCLQAEKQWHQHQQDLSMQVHTLIQIKIPADDLRWERKQKEIILNGKYFDVKDYQIRDNIAYIIGHFDHKESFFDFAFNYLKNKSNTPGENSMALQELQWFGVFTSIPINPSFSFEAFCFLRNIFFIQPTLFTKHPFQDMAGQPPWS